MQTNTPRIGPIRELSISISGGCIKMRPGVPHRLGIPYRRGAARFGRLDSFHAAADRRGRHGELPLVEQTGARVAPAR